LDDAAPRNELDPGLAQELVARVREVIGFEGDSAAEPAREAGEERPLRLDELDPRDCAARRRVAEVGEELDAVVRDEQRRVRALEARQVTDVGRVGDEKPLFERRAQTVDSIRGQGATLVAWTKSSAAPRLPRTGDSSVPRTRKPADSIASA